MATIPQYFYQEMLVKKLFSPKNVVLLVNNIKKGYLPADFFLIHGFNVSCDKCLNTHMKHIKKFLVVSNDKRTGRLETC